MGHKRQHREGESSSTRAFDKKKFVSAEAADRFDHLLAGRPLILERGLDPDGTDGEMLAMIYERVWDTFVNQPDPACIAIVKEFYANAEDTPACTVMVRGKTVSFHPTAINEYYNLPLLDTCQYASLTPDYDLIIRELCRPGTIWKRNAQSKVKSFPGKSLSRYGKIWYAFLCAKLMPCTHVGDVTWERAGLLYAIITGLAIDVGGVIAASIKRRLKGATSSGLPHPSLITELCRRAGVKWGAAESLQPPSTLLDHHLIQRYVVWGGGQSHPRGLGFIITQGEQSLPDASDAPANSSSAATITLQSIADQLECMQRRQEREHRRAAMRQDRLERQNHRLAARQGHIHNFLRRTNEAWVTSFSSLHPTVDVSPFLLNHPFAFYPPEEDANDVESADTDDSDAEDESDA